MKLIDYLKDKVLEISLGIFSLIIVIALLLVFNINKSLITYVGLIITINYVLVFLIGFIRKRKFYNEFDKVLEKLDQKYLITEIIKTPNFLEGKILTDYLYDINKSMIETINKYKFTTEEFIDYIELWCHEVKTPVATSKLIIENNQNEITNSINEEIEKINNYIEQVLYYTKIEFVEKDYMITKVDLDKIINNVIKKNKKSLISKKIKIEITNIDNVYSDSKWLEYIINQIIINSIKYSKQNKQYIKIYTVKNKNNVILNIEDNGIGISSQDINKVFDKGFTGENGHKHYNSTGMGLYLCKKLCDKLGSNIKIESKLNEFTKVSIVFPNNSLVNDIK